MWNIIITMTTVGYGDFYARTDLGRFMIFIVCVFGIFVLSMMMVTLISSLMTTSLEGKAITVLQRLEVR
jgi:potassium intermediate/small conductance calcium-activated channel subfamily N protein 2